MIFDIQILWSLIEWKEWVNRVHRGFRWLVKRIQRAYLNYQRIRYFAAKIDNIGLWCFKFLVQSNSKSFIFKNFKHENHLIIFAAKRIAIIFFIINSIIIYPSVVAKKSVTILIISSKCKKDWAICSNGARRCSCERIYKISWKPSDLCWERV